MRPYEAVKGSADKKYRKWDRYCQEFLSGGISLRKYNQICRSIIHDFDQLPITDEKKPRVGIVGEILVKFSPTANNHLAELLEKEGAEAVVPDLLDFFQYSFYNGNFKTDNLGFPKSHKLKMNAAVRAVELLRGAASKEFKKSRHFSPPANIAELAKAASPIVSNGNQTGEGWFLTGEMLELIGEGVPNIVCIQPFACLPNHIVGKGVIKEIRRRYPEANIAAVDYDPGASEVNQLNRIKLMLSTAQKQLR
jgi:predicted nucleotide-binding protein (sugar kinase/HSP70/actin superfamily)